MSLSGPAAADLPPAAAEHLPDDLATLKRMVLELLASLHESRRDNEALEHIARPFSKQFLVSPVAMRIRLEKLGLLHREVPRQRSFMAQQ